MDINKLRLFAGKKPTLSPKLISNFIATGAKTRFSKYNFRKIDFKRNIDEAKPK
jgi:hypothetical protein